MPEGHTVHRLARTLRELFGDESLRVSSPQGRFTDGARLLDGRRLVAVEAWGKQLFCGFLSDDGAGSVTRPGDDGVLWLRTHLGLYGAWTFQAAPGIAEIAHAIGAPRVRIGERVTTAPAVAPERGLGGGTGAAWDVPPPRGQVRVRLVGSSAVADLTGPTACEVITSDEKDAVTARLGPDPIRDGETGHDADRFVSRVGRSRQRIGQLLMDQAVIAGVGNIYRAEALFRAGVDPLLPGRDVPASALHAIWDDLVVLMRDGARAGAIVTTRPEDRDGTAVSTPVRRRTRQNTDGNPDAVPADQAFYVYHRDGLPCRVCGTPVRLKELAGRNLFWCGTCQA